MTTIAVLADPPRPGLVLPELAETSPLTEAEAAEFYAASLKDACLAVAGSGGELLVNYRPEDLLPETHRSETTAEAEVRALVAQALPDLDDVRFERQVGSTPSARAGNTVAHLLREEGVQSAAVVRGNAPLLTRSAVDSAAMKLRSSPVVLGPGTAGRAYYAAFAEPVDFEDALGEGELETLTERARGEGHAVDYIPLQPVVERGSDLLTLLPLLASRVAAERIVPQYTTTLVRDLGLRVAESDDSRRTVVRE